MTRKITVNGVVYDSIEAMPPEVRRQYDEAMKTLSSLPSGQDGGTTQVFTGGLGKNVGASVVVNRFVTVNNKTYGNLDEVPPEVRQQFQDAMQGGHVHPKTSVHVSLNVEGPQVRTLDAGKNPTPVPLPIESSSTESTIRNLPMSLAILVLIGLALWAYLGRQ